MLIAMESGAFLGIAVEEEDIDDELLWSV